MICICGREKTISCLFIIVRTRLNVKLHGGNIWISSEEVVIVKMVEHGSKGTNESYLPMI